MATKAGQKPEEPKAIQKVEPQEQALAAIPEDLMRDAGMGTDNIGTEDVQPPRLLICQSGSPQRKPDDPKQIPGLQELDMFNDLSGEIYGRGPLAFVVVSALGSRHIQFAPMSDGGGVIDFNVPPNDPRTLFTTNAEGKRVPPIATKFYDYLVWLPQQQDILVLSLKSTQIKVAIKLNGMIKMPLKINGKILVNPPSWARLFTLETKMDKRDSYSWGAFQLKLVGVAPDEVRSLARELAATYQHKNIIIEREPGDEPDFDPSNGGM